MSTNEYRIEQEAEPQALLTRAAMLVTYGRIILLSISGVLLHFLVVTGSKHEFHPVVGEKKFQSWEIADASHT